GTDTCRYSAYARRGAGRALYTTKENRPFGSLHICRPPLYTLGSPVELPSGLCRETQGCRKRFRIRVEHSQRQGKDPVRSLLQGRERNPYCATRKGTTQTYTARMRSPHGFRSRQGNADEDSGF